ncbi:helix-turn-helix transcriptional regulator [Herbidospora sp. NBRC 101105]|uniref:helix-turn-helix domain-containing protein n=1 Tax=Herbidospora sp. NBRC 101105 TaxID=3032195 RepID=UPI0024A5EF4B|nr:helix-turn-helix transcriptional regulator [Herbidospora sp. NBRC 101105]GLX93937.1 transcriptional regulator [Herbidospora sp. NBRC 101105]
MNQQDRWGDGAADAFEGDGSESQTRRRRLAGELRGLRDLAGLSGRQLADLIQISQSKVSRIESGATIPSLPEVRRWVEAVQAPAETRDRLADLTQAVVYEVHTWRGATRGKAHLQDDVRRQESEATLVRNFQCMVVPGLLQTAAYARAVFGLYEHPYGKGDLAAATAGRIRRQEALYDVDRRFEFLITESALRARPGPASLLPAQLDRIASVSTLETVRIGVIPQNATALVMPLHGFVIYGGDDDPDGSDVYVEVETDHARLTISDADVERYRRRWSLLAEMALFGDDVRVFLGRLAAEMQNEIRNAENMAF